MRKIYQLVLFFVLLLPCSLWSRPLTINDVLARPVVINLARHPQRYEATQRQLRKAGFYDIVRFDAIDGFDPNNGALIDFLGINRLIPPGAQGCCASHLLLLRNFVADPFSPEYLVVFEDDALLHSDFSFLLGHFVALTPERFDILYLGSDIGEAALAPCDVMAATTMCTHAYVVSKKGARKILSAFSSKDFYNPNLSFIDSFLFDLHRNHRIDAYLYNATRFPDPWLEVTGRISRGTGLCYQDRALGSSIYAPEIVFDYYAWQSSEEGSWWSRFWNFFWGEESSSSAPSSEPSSPSSPYSSSSNPWLPPSSPSSPSSR